MSLPKSRSQPWFRPFSRGVGRLKIATGHLPVPSMLQPVKNWFSGRHSQEAVEERLERLRQRAPVPLFWLFGKTQSGKTSIIKFLTGANDAEIGQGFRACTRFSREYEFPT